MERRYPKGHFIGLGIAIGLPLGLPIGLAGGNIAVGPAIGLALGAAIGVMLEKKRNPNPIELSKKEQNLRRKNLLLLLGLGTLVLLVVLGIYLFS